MATLSPNISYSQERQGVSLASDDTAALVELLQACNHTLGTCEQVRVVQDDIIKAQGEALVAGEARERALEKRLNDTIYTKVVWFAAGILLTGAAVALIK